jgi:hypothetical protein
MISTFDDQLFLCVCAFLLLVVWQGWAHSQAAQVSACVVGEDHPPATSSKIKAPSEDMYANIFFYLCLYSKVSRSDILIQGYRHDT